MEYSIIFLFICLILIICKTYLHLILKLNNYKCKRDISNDIKIYTRSDSFHLDSEKILL